MSKSQQARTTLRERTLTPILKSYRISFGHFSSYQIEETHCVHNNSLLTVIFSVYGKIKPLIAT